MTSNNNSLGKPHWWSDDWLDPSRGVPFPEWERIHEWFKVHEDDSSEQLNNCWDEICRYWCRLLQEWMGEEFGILESSHFILITNADKSDATRALRFLDSCYVQIGQILSKVIESPPEGLCPVLAFDGRYDFETYLAAFIEEDGEYGSAEGVYLNRGYGHFAAPGLDFSSYRRVFSHELAHAFVSHLDLPLWLNEALAMEVEATVTRENHYNLTIESIERHRELWNDLTIQSFWDGLSFGDAGELQELSYELAYHLFRTIVIDVAPTPDALQTFVIQTDPLDAGDSAAEEYLRVSLGNLVADFLGDGNWAPIRQNDSHE